MPAPQAYAPTTTTSRSILGTRNGVNHDQEITRGSITKTPALKTVYESLCEIFSVVSALEVVENSFVKDFLTDKEKYTATVMRLINQYNILVQTVTSEANSPTLKEILPGLTADNGNFLAEFQKKYRLHASLAADRLKTGVPVTIEQLPAVQNEQGAPNTLRSSVGANARLVAEATGNFITTMDALKLEYSSKLQLHPLLSSLVISLNELSTGSGAETKPIDFVGKSKLVTWLIKLNNLGDTEQLSAEEREDFLLDLDLAYGAFYNSLA